MRTLLLLIGLACSIWAGSTLAATMTVTTLSDTVADDGECSLREAILNAESADQSGSVDCPGGDEFGNSIYFSAALTGQTLVLSGQALPTITRDIEIYGPASNDPAGLVIDAAGSSRIFEIRLAGDVILSGLTLVNGWIDGPDHFGGAIWIDEGAAVSIEQVEFVRNRAGPLPGQPASAMLYRGGAIAVRDSWLSLKDVGLFENGSHYSGGALWSSNSALQIRGCEFRGNGTWGQWGSGGALHAAGGQVTINDSLFQSNGTLGDLGRGGAIAMVSAELVLGNSDILGNFTEGSGAQGGGVYVGSHDPLVSGSRISNNRTEGDEAGGGGLSVYDADLTLIDSTVDANWTEGAESTGGGIDTIQYGNDTGNAELSNVLVRNNRTQGMTAHGGGLMVRGRLEFQGGVVESNAAESDDSVGGGLIAASHISLERIAVINNIAGNGGAIAFAPWQANPLDVVIVNSTISGNKSIAKGQNAALMVFDPDSDPAPVDPAVNLHLLHATLADNDAVHVSDKRIEMTVNNSLLVHHGVACANTATSTSNSLATDASCAIDVATSAAIGLQSLSGGVHELSPDSSAIDLAANCVSEFGISVDQLNQNRPGLGSDHCDAGARERQNDRIFQDRFSL